PGIFSRKHTRIVKPAGGQVCVPESKPGLAYLTGDKGLKCLTLKERQAQLLLKPQAEQQAATTVEQEPPPLASRDILQTSRPHFQEDLRGPPQDFVPGSELKPSQRGR